MAEIKLTDRSFRTQVIRPRPDSYVSGDGKLVVILTPWGDGEALSTQSVFEEIESQYNLLSADREKTHPFSKMMSLSVQENNMRTTVRTINQQIFEGVNEEEWHCGFEIFFASIQDNICTFIQVGQPMVLIERSKNQLHCLGHSADLASFCYSSMEEEKLPAPPLPGQLLGVYPDISFHPVSFRFSLEDSLILLSRQLIPLRWFETLKEGRDLNTLSEHARKDNPHLPFWIGRMEFK